jgi:hypothetical protein
MSVITKVSQLRPHPHIHADDLDGDTPVTIKGWIFGEAGMEKQVLGKLILEEFDRHLIVNAGKRDALIAAFGDDVEAIKGKKVVLFPTTTSFAGKTVPAVGMRVPKPTAPAT